jgi:TolB protein
LMEADGSDIRNITRDTLDCYSPSWSPDGKWIAYTAGSENQYDIYIIHPDSGEKRRLTHTSVRNESPSWGPVKDH